MTEPCRSCPAEACCLCEGHVGAHYDDEMDVEWDDDAAPA